MFPGCNLPIFELTMNDISMSKNDWLGKIATGSLSVLIAVGRPVKTAVERSRDAILQTTKPFGGKRATLVNSALPISA
jgi:hypothetical protein